MEKGRIAATNVNIQQLTPAILGCTKEASMMVSNIIVIRAHISLAGNISSKLTRNGGISFPRFLIMFVTKMP